MMTDEYTTKPNYEAECIKLKEKLDCIYAENQELKCALDAVRVRSAELEASNTELLSKIEFYKGQIDAYQYCMNCRRQQYGGNEK